MKKQYILNADAEYGTKKEKERSVKNGIGNGNDKERGTDDGYFLV